MGKSCLIQAWDRIDFGHIGKEHGEGGRIREPKVATAKTDSSVVPQGRMQAWFQALAFISVVTLTASLGEAANDPV